MARAIGHDAVRGVARETRAVQGAGEVDSVPLGGAKAEDGAVGEELDGGGISGGGEDRRLRGSG